MNIFWTFSTCQHHKRSGANLRLLIASRRQVIDYPPPGYRLIAALQLPNRITGGAGAPTLRSLNVYRP
ncbi:MAG: hypothetical protein K2Z81_24270 [Cyanobacteria bacterium]|nr:hypothetical protein [Cyanobacteriota bacterium]